MVSSERIRPSFLIVPVMAFAAMLPTIPASAKRPSVDHPASPCTEPDAFVRRQIAKIKELRAPGGIDRNEAPKTVAELFARMENTEIDAGTQNKIADLRQQADTFNALLKAEGCKTVDIDAELKRAQVAPGDMPEDK